MEKRLISVIVPCYNEEMYIHEIYERIRNVFHGPEVLNGRYDFELLFVDNGSYDRTYPYIKEFCFKDPRVKLISLSRNFGYQGGILAGLVHARGDAAAIIDADMQDPPELIPRFLKHWEEGYKVVYGIKTKRREGVLLRACYSLFYKIFSFVSEEKFPQGAGDFALMDQQVYRFIRSTPEHNRFIRALRFWSGFRQIGIPYERSARDRGISKHPFNEAAKLAMDGFLSFSSYPLRFMTKFGFFVLLLSLSGIVYIFAWKYAHPHYNPGYAFLMTCILFLGGVQMMSLGILGEYIYRILNETRNRPHFLVQEVQNISELPNS